MVELLKEKTEQTLSHAKIILNVLIYALALYGAYTIIVLKGLKLLAILGK